ncbi:MAG: glycine/D-amino acid oxidase-like deaminating enzyme [Gammaproteobacteria bacterium]|jgi:glycine/D-amino acid oxidase-like deaminating enzyme
MTYATFFETFVVRWPLDCAILKYRRKYSVHSARKNTTGAQSQGDLSMTTQAARSIGIVGAGIIGVQLARDLQRRGLHVTLFDGRDPGMATSFGNAGYLATDEIFPLAHGAVLRSLPRMLLNPIGPLVMRWKEFPRLLPWYVKYLRACSGPRARHSINALANLQRTAAADWKNVVALEHLHDLVLSNGAMTVFETDQAFRRTQLQRAVQLEYGINWQSLSGDAARDKVPELSAKIRHAVVYPAGMHVTNPYAVTKKIFDRFLNDGGTFIRANVEQIERSGRRLSDLTADGQRHPFDSMIVCTGHLSGRLLKPLNYKVPIVAERGYHVEMSHAETRLNCPVGSSERGFYVTPMSTGLRLAGTTEFSSADHDEPPTWGRADILKRHVAELMPGLAEQETGRWMGHRPTMPDFLPVLGSVADCDNLFLAFGHHHLGLTLSAVTARLLGDLVVGTKEAADLTPFSLDRFQ